MFLKKLIFHKISSFVRMSLVQEVLGMKKLNKITALIVVFLMVLGLIACGKSDNQSSTSEKDTTSAYSGPTEITVNLHYLRSDGAYTGWNVWAWTTGDGKAYNFGSETDDAGATTSVTVDAGTKSVGFIVRLNEWEQKDTDADRFIDTSSILAGTVDVYITSGEEEFKTEFGDDCVKGTGISSAIVADDFSSVSVTLTSAMGKKDTLQLFDGSDKEIEIKSTKANKSDKTKVVVTLKEPLDEFGTYTILLNSAFKYDVTLPDIYSTENFEKEYTYSGDDLGATWSKNSTTFVVWAPTADSVLVNLYESGEAGSDDLIKSEKMSESDNGTWTGKVTGDLKGKYYTYTVKINETEKEACDPYAKAVGVNGDRGMVIDLESTNPEGWDQDTNPNADLEYTDSVIYETHIRDLTVDSSSGIKNPGKYIGLIENGTTNATGQSTGLDHILDLGVTHVQLTPVYDFATVDETALDSNQYNWGYDPKNYNVPEGSYSTDPYDGAVRVKEFKEMVQGLHTNGLSVVMDVVYNHTYSTDFCFNQIVPDYFYRPGSNGSGCGNDVASERAMVRKYIVDSVVYWATEYHIDGFRFDLVGLIDVDTIKAVRAALDQIDPTIILYGEGWSMTTIATKENTYMATQNFVSKIPNFGMFNDTLRDALKGSVFTATEKGFVNGNLAKGTLIAKAVTGKVSWSSTPYQQINYASCHDNLTLWDEINSSNGTDSYDSRVRQNLLTASIVYTSQGIPFMLAGEEMLRSKLNADGTFNENSYNASDEVNSIKWDDLSDEAYQSVYNYYKGLIAFRKAHSSFTLMEDAQSNYKFSSKLPDGVIAYALKAAKDEVSDGFFVIYNATFKPQTVKLPAGSWTICVQDEQAGTESLGTATGSVVVSGISCTILVKGDLK